MEGRGTRVIAVDVGCGDDAAVFSDGRRHVRLSAREIDVLRLVIQGKENVVIAQLLGITRRTAGAHVARLFRELCVETRVDLAQCGRELLGLNAGPDLRKVGELAQTGLKQGTPAMMRQALERIVAVVDAAAAREAL